MIQIVFTFLLLTPRKLTYLCMLSHFSGVQLFVTPWTVALQASLSMEFSRQEYWSGLPFPSPGDLLNPGTELRLPHCRQILYHWATRQALRQLSIHTQKKNIGPEITVFTKVSSKQIKDLNVRVPNIKLGRKHRSKSFDPAWSNGFLNIYQTPTVQAIKEKNKSNFIKIKNCCFKGHH